MRTCLAIRKNNKGNTLAVVLVSIFVLSILGTLILGLTATNYKMRVTEKKAETTFYYAEKAMDEIYAGIGKEVMDITKASYEEVVENLVYQDGSGNTASLSNSEATAKFGSLYITALQSKFPAGEVVDTSTLYTALNGYIKANSELVFKLNLNYDGTNKTEVVHNTDSIEIKNVCVETTTVSNGYFSSVVADFKIDTPAVSFEIEETEAPISANIDNIAEYTIIAQGMNIASDNKEPLNTAGYYPTVLVKANKKVNITGNVYAGMGAEKNYLSGTDEDGNALYSERSAITVQNGATLNSKSNYLVCDGPITVYSGNIDFKGKDGNSDFRMNNDTLNLYATDLITTGDSDEVNIVGNCMISDDMEINGNKSTVEIKGNYYGYGFLVAGTDKDILNHANNAIVEADNGIADSGFVTMAECSEKEHELRSAIIINGRNANVDLSGLEELILAGRAYIDLDSGVQYGNASYMTGESISFKGNQKTYMADETSGLQGNNFGNANPIAYQALLAKAAVTDGNELSYGALGLNENIVVAKKFGDKVYFYDKQVNPLRQSRNFRSAYDNNPAKKAEMESLVRDLNINLTIGTGLRYYSVGNFMTASSGRLDVKRYDGNYAGNMTQTEFYNIIKEINVRKSYLTPGLEIFDDKPSVLPGDISGNRGIISTGRSSDTGTVYEKHVDQDKIDTLTAGGSVKVEHLETNSATVLYDSDNDGIKETGTIAYFVQRIIGTGNNVGYYIDKNKDDSSTECSLDAGMWVSGACVKLTNNFSGLIIANGTVSFNDDVELSCNEELIKFMLTCDDSTGVFNSLREAVRVPTENAVVGSADVNSTGIAYSDIVKRSNWRRNTN